MALANVACLLARQGNRVLMIDWDLEAPGLHRYFRSLVTRRFHNTAAGDSEFEIHPGLLDLFLEFDAATRSGDWTGSEQSQDAARPLVGSVDLDRFVIETDVDSVDFMKAGRFDEQYATRVNTFQWDALYDRSTSLIRYFAERLTEHYSYVLIDSRTGLTDISGICTMLMPDQLVVVFTPNRQSLTGVLDLMRQATDYRRQSDDLRPIGAFPLASRIEVAEPTLRDDWRFGNSQQQITGYQSQFEELFKEVYDLDECNLQTYFDEVQIQHIPRFAYGEEIAVRVERGGDRLSLTRSYEAFTDRLVGLSGPWEDLTPVEVQKPAPEQPVSRGWRRFGLAGLGLGVIAIAVGGVIGGLAAVGFFGQEEGPTDEVAYPVETDSQGVVQTTGELTSLDGSVNLTLLADTVALGPQGNPLRSIAIIGGGALLVASPPTPPGQLLISRVYEFTPSGATFDPPITLTFHYEPSELSPDVDFRDLAVSRFSRLNDRWEQLPNAVRSPSDSAISADLSRLEAVALVAGAALPPVDALIEALETFQADSFPGKLISALPFEVTADNSEATLEDEEPQVCADLGATLWYRYTPEEDVVLRADTFGSGFDTVLSVFMGTPDEPVDCNVDVDVDDKSSDSGVSFEALAGHTYYFQIGGAEGQTGMLAFHLTAEATAPAQMEKP